MLPLTTARPPLTIALGADGIFAAGLPVLAGDAQETGGLGALSVGGGQRAGDGLLFALGQGDDGRWGGQGECGHPHLSIRVRQGAVQALQFRGCALVLQGGGQVGHLQGAFGVKGGHAVQAVLQLADVAWPVVGDVARSSSPKRNAGKPEASPRSRK